MSIDSGDKTPTTSGVTGRGKYVKRSKTKEDIDKAELQFMQKIGNRLEQQTKKSVEKDEESIFGELIATQLKLSQPSQVQALQTTGFRLPEFETVGHPPLFNAGYFFQQHQQNEN